MKISLAVLVLLPMLVTHSTAQVSSEFKGDGLIREKCFNRHGVIKTLLVGSLINVKLRKILLSLQSPIISQTLLLAAMPYIGVNSVVAHAF